MSETDATERRRLGNETNDALQIFREVDAEFQQLRRSLEDYQNDYDITGCRDILGPL